VSRNDRLACAFCQRDAERTPSVHGPDYVDKNLKCKKILYAEMTFAQMPVFMLFLKV
jgi:hypothetical protein